MESNALETIKTTLQGFVAEVREQVTENNERVAQMEQHLAKGSTFAAGNSEVKSIGQLVTEHEQCKSFLSQGQRHSGKIPVGSFFSKSTIVSDGSTFAPATRVPQIGAAYVPLRVRDLLATGTATSNIVEFVREASSDNQAGPQGADSSPFQVEAIAKAESGLTFELVPMPVVTIATWISASKQVLDDSAALAAFLNQRMTYFVKLSEEGELLNGTGVGGHLTGLVTSATPLAGFSPPPSEQKLDIIRAAIGPS